MIFAILDYLQYRLMLGKYSITEIARNQGVLCTKENISNYMTCKGRKNVLVFLHTRISFISWIIMYYTDSLWSHCALLFEDNCIIESTIQGIIKTNPSCYIDNRSYFFIIYPTELTDIEYKDARARLDKLVGKHYNWAMAIGRFVYIILGISHKWRIKHSLDIYLLIGILKFFEILSGISSIIITFTYSILLFWNLARYRLIPFYKGKPSEAKRVTW